MEAHTGDQPSMLHCTECSASLVHDQRYCLECGVRRGPLPRQVAGLIGAILEHPLSSQDLNLASVAESMAGYVSSSEATMAATI